MTKGSFFQNNIKKKKREREKKEKKREREGRRIRRGGEERETK